jgi:anhydro-N-acetylmuramic acid kinase
MMTGTSCDGLDAVAVRFERDQFQVRQRWSRTYPENLREQVLAFQQPGARHSSQQWLKLHRDLGAWYARTAASIVRSSSTRVDGIANHGQTLAHFPGIGTLQMGDPAHIAERTGLTVISQFRTGDMAAGGQGAPLVPKFHQLLAQITGVADQGVAIHNLGGISNLTYIHGAKAPLAWDTGPGNLWIDLAVSGASAGRMKMDAGGRLANLGSPRPAVVRKLLAHPYFKRRAPKSTGRDDFTQRELGRMLRGLSIADAAATTTLATAESIVSDYCTQILDRGLPLESIYFCGGGARNPTLLGWIKAGFIHRGWLVSIRQSAELGVQSQDMEAAAFAYLGKEALLGRALGGSWTGARRFGPPAQITPGRNWLDIVDRIHSLR